MKKLVFLVVLLSGCAQSPVKQLWTTNDSTILTRAQSEGLWLRGPDGSNYKFITARRINNLLMSQGHIEQASGIRAQLAVVETDEPNAFAWSHEGTNYVAFSISYLDAVGDDIDAVATTMGHELAHIKLKHGEARQARESGKQAVGFALGFALAAVGIPGALADIGTTAIYSSFTRDEEREADEQGLKWVVEAGYDPCGQARVFAKFNGMEIPFLSSHPGYKERSEMANQYSLQSRGVPCQ